MTTTFVSDNRSIINECDANTGWTGSHSVATNTSVEIEATGCLSMLLSTTTGNAYVSITSDDLSQGSTLSMWARTTGVMDTLTNGGVAIQVGDGTNRIGYHVGGANQSSFRHESGPVEWACFILDLANKPANNTAYAGTEASLDETAITQIGVGFKTLAKAVGGIENVFWDIIRFADPGDDVVFVGGTTSGAAGNGSEIAAIDLLTGNQQAYGVFRELGSGVYGIQGNITLGNTASSSDQYWTESNVTYAWEDRGLFDRNYYRFNLVGSSTATNIEYSFTSTTFNVPTSAAARFDFNGADITVCNIISCTFLGVNVGIIGSDDTGDDWTGCAYSGCGALEVKGCDHSGSTFTGSLEAALTESQDETSYDDTTTEGGFTGGSSYAATDTITLDNGALITVDTVSAGVITEFTVTTSEGYPANEGQLLSQSTTSGSGTGFTLWPRSANLTEGGSIFYNLNVDPDGELDNCSFTKGTDATHAIVFGPSVPATMTLRGIDFSGYNGTDEQTDSTLHFLDTSGTITVNLIDCTGNISSKSEGATINLVVSPVTTKITCENQAGTLLENVRVFLETSDNGGGSGLPYQASVSTLTQTGGTATLTASAAHGLATNDYVVIRGASDEYYNKTAQITVTSTTVFTYSVNTSAGASAGGTPVFSYCPISGLTNSLGVIQSSKSWPAAQGVSGWARKSTASPYYKESPISITDASGGTDLLVLMISDE